MPKSRLNVVDIAALIHDVRALCIGRRVSNIYDLDQKTFLLKMYKPDSPKVLLLLESGVRPS